MSAAAVLMGGGWLALSVWAAARAQAIVRPGQQLPTLAEGLTLAGGLVVALVGHAVFFRRSGAALSVIPLLLVAAVWGGLAAEGHVLPADAVGLALVTAAWLASTGKPPRPAAIGLPTGLAVAASPLLIGAVFASFWTLPTKVQHPMRRRALSGWMVGGLIVGLAVAVALGQPVWTRFAQRGWVYDLGPAAVWRHLADLLDLAAPLLVVAALGAVMSSRWARPRGADLDHDAGARLWRGLCVWLVFNAVLACVAPRLAAGHMLALIAPAALLATPGWNALRALLSKPAPLTTALPGAVCVFLLAVLAWAPLRAAGRALLIALLPP
jgi:hypothetical protein